MRPNLKAGTHQIVQIALFGAQFLLPAFAHFTTKQEVAVAAFISAVQAYLGYSASYTNPDGTPVSKENK